VALLRDDSGFATAINRAAKELGLHPQFVEKDYWVTEVLRSLHRDFAAHFIFKGGTSLSKGYGLIERFSEDIDILVVADAGSSARRRERKLLHILTVAQSLGLPYHEKRAPGKGRDAHRADLLIFEPVVQQSIQTGLGRGGNPPGDRIRRR
jgi:predicted nucleotidyltransferase component of viral defense system